MNETAWSSDTWCRFLPALHRELADPCIESGLPRSFVSLNFEDTCAWWETLRYLFRSLVGWRNLPAGLAWWYENCQPHLDDPRLQLVRDRWNTRGELDIFAAREWESRGCTGMTDDGPLDFPDSYEPHPGWWNELRERSPFSEPSPWGGGYNPLHLGHSDSVGLDEPAEEPMTMHDRVTRRAVLVASSFGSWRRQLELFGRSLPDLAGRSWHIEVFDRAIGYLGTYRQSRETGLWFQGKHSVHLAGNSRMGRET
ncbi:MAG: hypothetical protein KDN18_19185 [Verrucomicrobiae bacterium]|nr:hypothetical protein [Verrucomicrobiae bacterium]